MKLKYSILVCAFVTLTSAVSSAGSFRGGGGGGPDPLTFFNEYVELADGENYLLVGQVVMAPTFQGSSRKLQPYLEVDLTQHPWLAGKLRKSRPLYPLEGSVASWKALEGTTLKLASRAHAQVIFAGSESPLQIISLRPIMELSVIPYSGEPNQKR